LTRQNQRAARRVASKENILYSIRTKMERDEKWRSIIYVMDFDC